MLSFEKQFSASILINLVPDIFSSHFHNKDVTHSSVFCFLDLILMKVSLQYPPAVAQLERKDAGSLIGSIKEY